MIRRCGKGGWRPCKSLASVGRTRCQEPIDYHSDQIMKRPPAAERRTEGFLEKVTEINAALSQTRPNARIPKRDEPWQAHGRRSLGPTVAAQSNQEKPTDIAEGSYV
jgi:hypothetical protein